jgi:DNA-binding NtrC family response regulator
VRVRSIDSVLVIDDDPLVLETLAVLLNSIGVEQVLSANSAEDALRILSEKDFSLIVSDYRLEGMNGVELLEQLREGGNQTPMLLLSGAPDRAGVFRTGHHQKVEFYPKPFELRDFMGAMDKLAA